MKLSEIGVRWPVTTSMIFIAIIVLGGFSFTRVGIDLMPDLDIPVITIITAYPGAGPQEVETRITELIETRVAAVENVNEVRSNSIEGVSIVTVKFNWETNLAEAANDIRDKLGQLNKRLPSAAEDPIIFKLDMGAIPVQIMGVTATENWDKIDRIIEDKIVNRLKRLPGVAAVFAEGNHKRTINVRLNREKLQATGIAPNRIVNILRRQNISNPGGHLKTGNMDFLIRVPEEFKTVEEIGEVVISNHNGIVRLRDVAEIEDGFAEISEDIVLDGKAAMAIIVQKQSDANTVAVSNAIKEALPEIEKDLPSDVKITEFVDTSNFIRSTIDNLRDSIFLGGIGVFLVILLFIQDVRASIIIAVTIPTSLIITFLLMHLNDFTINQMSMSSLAIAIGMVVDNAIVVLDNIKRYIDRGVRSRESAIWGAAEMGTSVMASTMTTLAIFLPIVFTTGITKIMFGQLALIISMALIASLFTALLLTPMMCSKMLTYETKKKNAIFNFFGNLLTKLEAAYSSLLSHALNHRFIVLIILMVAFVASLGIIPLVGIEYMPQQDQGIMNIELELPTGTRYEETGRVCRQVVEILNEELKGLVKASFASFGVGENMESLIMNPKKSSDFGTIQIVLISRNHRKELIKDIITRVRPILEQIPGVIIRFVTTDPIGEMITGGSAEFSINIYGHELEEGMTYANNIKNALEKIKYLQDLEISQKLAKPELQVIVNREKAASFGLNVSDISETIELLFSGDKTIKYRDLGDEYDIDIRLREEDRLTIDDILQVAIVTPAGDSVRLNNLVDVVQGVGPSKIERLDQERFIRITGQVFGTDPGTVNSMAEGIINSIPAPPGFSWAHSGSEKERKESFLLLIQAAVLGMLLVYMVMASQFESLLAPFIIFLSVPFGFMGAIQLLAITGNRISVVSFLGFIILIGIVVNNGIVLISYVNTLIGRGYKTRKALLEAGVNRLRPVLSTTATTCLGMLPMALTTGDGSEVWVPIGLSVIGGLVVSTIMTLVLMPVLYSLMQRWLVPAEQRTA